MTIDKLSDTRLKLIAEALDAKLLPSTDYGHVSLILSVIERELERWGAVILIVSPAQGRRWMEDVTLRSEGH